LGWGGTRDAELGKKGGNKKKGKERKECGKGKKGGPGTRDRSVVGRPRLKKKKG